MKYAIFAFMLCSTFSHCFDDGKESWADQMEREQPIPASRSPWGASEAAQVVPSAHTSIASDEPFSGLHWTTQRSHRREPRPFSRRSVQDYRPKPAARFSSSSSSSARSSQEPVTLEVILAAIQNQQRKTANFCRNVKKDMKRFGLALERIEQGMENLGAQVKQIEADVAEVKGSQVEAARAAEEAAIVAEMLRTPIPPPLPLPTFIPPAYVEGGTTYFPLNPVQP